MPHGNHSQPPSAPAATARYGAGHMRSTVRYRRNSAESPAPSYVVRVLGFASLAAAIALAMTGCSLGSISSTSTGPTPTQSVCTGAGSGTPSAGNLSSSGSTGGQPACSSQTPVAPDALALTTQQRIDLWLTPTDHGTPPPAPVAPSKSDPSYASDLAQYNTQLTAYYQQYAPEIEYQQISTEIALVSANASQAIQLHANENPFIGVNVILLGYNQAPDGTITLVGGGTWTDANNVSHPYVVTENLGGSVSLTSMDFWYGNKGGIIDQNVPASSLIPSLNSSIGKQITMSAIDFQQEPAQQPGVSQETYNMVLDNYNLSQWIKAVKEGKPSPQMPSFIGTNIAHQPTENNIHPTFITLPNGVDV